MNFKHFIITANCVCFLAGCVPSTSENTGQTPFEISGGNRTATYNETMEFCNKAQALSANIQMQTIGESSQGYEIPMLIIDRNQNFTTDKVRHSGNAVLLIQANIHSGEPDGNDAGMLLINEMLSSGSFPANTTILFIPVMNPDGLNNMSAYSRINQNGPEEVGWRTNGQRLNLNRDFVKADSPEIQAWLKIFNAWLPDFTMDIHVTDGADYQYVLTYIMENMGNMDASQTQWQNSYIDNVLNAKMTSAGYPSFPYVSFKQWHNPRSGLYMRPSLPMMSTGYLALQNRPAIVVETHSLKPFKQRVEAVLCLIKETIMYIEKEYKALLEINRQSDSLTVQLAQTNGQYPLSYSLVDSCDTVDFKGVEYDITHSDLTGGDWFQYHSELPQIFRIPIYKTIEPSDFINIPAAYIIPPEWFLLIKSKLDLHGIEYKTLDEEVEVNLNICYMNNPAWGKTPVEGRIMLNSIETSETTQYQLLKRGTIIVPTSQRRAKLISTILEPQSGSSLLKYGFFNAVFEQVEYFETYVMEPMSRQMLDTSADMRKRFQIWKNKQTPPPSSYEQLHWFYRQTPYYDSKKNMYPIFMLGPDTFFDY